MNIDIFDSKIFKDLTSTKFGASFILGFAVGYLLKKSIKLVFLFLILGVVALFWLDSSRIDEIKNIDFSSSLDRVIELFKMFGDFVYSKVGEIDQSSGIGIVVGFLLGLKFG